MPRGPNVPLPQPPFDEPVFSQGKPTPDPTRLPTGSDRRANRPIELFGPPTLGEDKGHAPGLP